jgi:hypothetical protein
MEIPVSHPEFQAQRLTVDTAGLWRGPRLRLNGALLEGKKGVFSARNDAGVETALVLKPGFPDTIPKLQVGGVVIELARPLVWYEYAWMGAAVVLIFSGGALGAGFGLLALHINAQIFRSDLGVVARYALTGLVSAATVLAFVSSAIIVGVLIGH